MDWHKKTSDASLVFSFSAEIKSADYENA